MQVALIAAVLLAGCNQVYGLEQTKLRDGAGPPICTSEAPKFRETPVLVSSIPDTRFYSISLDHQIAVAVRAGTLYEGKGDAELVAGALLMPPPPSTPHAPRLAPEGDELFVGYSPTVVTGTINRYAREDGKWVLKAQVLSINANTPDFSMPTRRSGAPRRMVVLTGVSDLREFVETSPDQWSEAGAYTPAELGASSMRFPNLTSDGLRLVFQALQNADPALMYASRARVEDRFGTATNANPFFGNPRINDPQLADDCGRLYFHVANPQGVYYVER